MRYDALASGPTVYAYVGGNPVPNTDPLGLDPSFNFPGVEYAQQAQGFSATEAFNTWWNTPDPCMKKKLNDKYGPTGTWLIANLSLAGLAGGPWNLNGGPGDSWTDVAVSAASKPKIFQWINKMPYGPYVTKGLGTVGSLGVIWATVENIRAISSCGCENQ